MAKACAHRYRRVAWWPQDPPAARWRSRSSPPNVANAERSSSDHAEDSLRKYSSSSEMRFSRRTTGKSGPGCVKTLIGRPLMGITFLTCSTSTEQDDAGHEDTHCEARSFYGSRAPPRF